MGKSSAPVAKVLERFSERVSNKLAQGRRFLRNELPFTTTTVANPKTKSVSAGPVTHIIIICLSYYGMFWNVGGSMTLNGPKHDFFHLLDHFGYDDSDNAIEFTLLHDFDVVRRGSNGQETFMSKKDTSKAAIMEAIKETMQSVAPGSKVVFYFGGHGGEGVEEQTIVAGDGELISGMELRDCLNNTPYDSVSVAAIFDACHSGGSMGLPYNYAKRWFTRGIRPKRVTREKQEVPMIQISAARRGQSAYSNNYQGGYYGQLTWCLLQYLNTAKDSTIEGLSSYLYKNCDPSGAQKPQVSASHPFRGLAPFFF